MPDITMCTGQRSAMTADGEEAEKPLFVCPKRDKCYRYTATPNEYRQAYFVLIPYDYRKNTCDYFSKSGE